MSNPGFELLSPVPATWFDDLRQILRECADSLPVDLSFQSFDLELEDLPGEYASPRGALFLGLLGGDVAGCCAVRPIDNVDYSNACEMKRLYVRPPFRGKGLGRRLAESAMEAGRIAGYDHILLDTLNEMESARALYEELGFFEIPPFYRSPISGAHYLLARL